MGRTRGMRGKPTALKLLQGVKREDELNRNEPKPKIVEYVEPPDHLTPQEVKYWEYYYPILYDMHIMTIADVKQLEIFCGSCADADRYKKIIEEEGDIIQVPQFSRGIEMGDKSIVNPAVRLLEMARKCIDRFGGSLCLTPVDRSRAQVQQAERGGNPEGIGAFIKTS